MSDCCGGSNVLIYSCSGAADLGEVSDRTARKLRDMGVGKMSCLAAIGAALPGYLESAKGSDKNIVIEGCQVMCGKKNFDKAGVNCVSYVLTEMGFVKGKTPATEKIISEAADSIMKAELGEMPAKKTQQSGGNCGCGGKC